jgi:hypothetical protein
MVGPARENWREVDQIGAELLNVVEVLGYAIEVAAVELPANDVVDVDDGVVPLLSDRPIGYGRAVFAGGGETVGEDLVDDGVADPRGWFGEGC